MRTIEVQKMSTSERLVAMEQLWDALCSESEGPASPIWHEEVLEKRKARMNSSAARFYTLDQLREQLR